MKLKRPILALVLIVLIGCFALTPLLASASVTVANGSFEVLPGNPQSSSPAYSKAWLDTVIIRDGSTAITACKPIPKPDYPYSKTYEEFVDEVARYDVLHDLNETTVGVAYDELIDTFYYMVTAMGMTDKQSTMKAYLTDYGIAVPTNPTSTEQAEIAGVYATLKYNAPYVLYEKDVTLPKGTTLEGAEVALMADRCAIDEELSRLESHIAQMRQALATEGEIGRRLDFLTQELNREVNTIGSKASDADITRLVVAAKSEIEKLREQVQNVE